ncbi:Cyclic nucleotide-gated cation channel beta-3 [Cichlidogyrus casuarinus]|uniref:Cyclic nucleotide-gated cation channel beta-3 n=1 Tax=Cichlidogyrus casuarinus TaxID=1844966 RepID=A0ABD2PPA8_9PLAT
MYASESEDDIRSIELLSTEEYQAFLRRYIHSNLENSSRPTASIVSRQVVDEIIKDKVHILREQFGQRLNSCREQLLRPMTPEEPEEPEEQPKNENETKPDPEPEAKKTQSFNRWFHRPPRKLVICQPRLLTRIDSNLRPFIAFPENLPPTFAVDQLDESIRNDKKLLKQAKQKLIDAEQRERAYALEMQAQKSLKEDQKKSNIVLGPIKRWLERRRKSKTQQVPEKIADEQNEHMQEVQVIGEIPFEPQFIKFNLPGWIPSTRLLFITMSPHSVWYLLWLLLVVMAVCYNYVSLPLRSAFHVYDLASGEQGWPLLWKRLDWAFDLIYLLDLIILKPRLEFLRGGIVETSLNRCIGNYLRSVHFRINSFWEFFDRADQRVSAGFLVRFTKTLIYMIYIMHLESCGYYVFNRWEGMGSTRWCIPEDLTNSYYVYSFYLAMKTATSIGNLPSATNIYEFLFMTLYWLSGVYVSAILIGQIIDILDSTNANRNQYREIMDTTITHMQQLKCPQFLIHKVRVWFMHNWAQQKSLDENAMFEHLPTKLKSDLAISVHYETLSKVSLFADCERTLIFDLILKLKPILFLPGDYICQKVGFC